MGTDSTGGGGSTGEDPAELLGELSRLRRRTRAARHGYWFPLVMFGVLGCAAAPLYVAAGTPPGRGVTVRAAGAPLPLLGGLHGPAGGFYLGWYWAAALAGGYLLTVAWYRRHARAAGVRTPARGYLITGAAAIVLAAALPPLSRAVPPLAVVWLPLGGGWARGTLAFLIIAAGLWVLARAERSRALAAIALVYTASALLASLYDVSNLLLRWGWNPGASGPGWRLAVLPNVLLPALVLLAAGAASFPAQRRRAPA